MEQQTINLLLITFIVTIFFIYLNFNKTQERFLNKPMSVSGKHSDLVDPLACYPGTYWRNKTFKDLCVPMERKRPLRLDVEGKPIRNPEPRYEIVCDPDQHLNRNCRLVKVYDQYY